MTSGTQENKIAQADEKVDTIRFGLKAIKNVGEHIAEEVIKERKTGGPYRDMSDLLERITDKDLNKKSLESLIKSGAFDLLGERGVLLHNIDNMLSFNKEIAKTKHNGQSSLFADAPNIDYTHQVKLVPAEEAARQQKLAWEKELLGLYITEHPFVDFKKQLDGVISPLREIAAAKAEQTVNAAGIIIKVQKIITRTNKSMLFVKIEDDTAAMEILVFPNLLEKTQSLWVEGQAVIVSGRLSDKDREMKILANTARPLTLEKIDAMIKDFKADHPNGTRLSAPAPAKPFGDLVILLNSGSPARLLEALKTVLEKHPGGNRVIFKIKTADQEKTIMTEHRVKYTPLLRSILKTQFNQFIEIE